MVIAGVCIDKKIERKLKLLGVKDSKKLSPKKREELFNHIEILAKDIVVLKVPACKIDKYRSQKINLDRIEAMKIADIIRMMNADVFYIDSIEFNSERFKKMILEYLPEEKKNAKLIVKNYMDESVTVVGAASIIAKVERDRAIKEIQEKVGVDIGIGYSHDEKTIRFVESLIKSGKELPDYVRKSWITTQMLQEKSLQSKIKDFLFRKKEC
jgi:ribonuclease HII